MNRVVLIVCVVAFFTNCHARDFYFEFENDPNYPKLVDISNVVYKFEGMNKFLDISFTLTVYEELNDGVNVSEYINFDFNFNAIVKFECQMCFKILMHIQLINV